MYGAFHHGHPLPSGGCHHAASVDPAPDAVRCCRVELLGCHHIFADEPLRCPMHCIAPTNRRRPRPIRAIRILRERRQALASAQQRPLTLRLLSRVFRAQLPNFHAKARHQCTLSSQPLSSTRRIWTRRPDFGPVLACKVLPLSQTSNVMSA